MIHSFRKTHGQFLGLTKPMPKGVILYNPDTQTFFLDGVQLPSCPSMQESDFSGFPAASWPASSAASSPASSPSTSRCSSFSSFTFSGSSRGSSFSSTSSGRSFTRSPPQNSGWSRPMSTGAILYGYN